MEDLVQDSSCVTLTIPLVLTGQKFVMKTRTVQKEKMSYLVVSKNYCEVPYGLGSMFLGEGRRSSFYDELEELNFQRSLYLTPMQNTAMRTFCN